MRELPWNGATTCVQLIRCTSRRCNTLITMRQKKGNVACDSRHRFDYLQVDGTVDPLRHRFAHPFAAHRKLWFRVFENANEISEKRLGALPRNEIMLLTSRWMMAVYYIFVHLNVILTWNEMQMQIVFITLLRTQENSIKMISSGQRGILLLLMSGQSARAASWKISVTPAKLTGKKKGAQVCNWRNRKKILPETQRYFRHITHTLSRLTSVTLPLIHTFNVWIIRNGLSTSFKTNGVLNSDAIIFIHHSVGLTTNSTSLKVKWYKCIGIWNQIGLKRRTKLVWDDSNVKLILVHTFSLFWSFFLVRLD